MIYLDYAASCVPFAQAAELSCRLSLSCYASPGAIHSSGDRARNVLNESRKTLAQLLQVRDREVFFTSGGTEANNWAVKLGCRQGRGRTILVGATEHKSVLEAAFAMEKEGFRVKLLSPDHRGFISPAALEEAMTPDVCLVCIQAVNNETGALQDIEAISRITRKARVPFLCDAVQAFGHVDLPLHRADFITLSAHKFGGLRGAGCLAVRYPYTLPPLLHGGGQELGLRSGTENVPGIAAMAWAARQTLAEMPREGERLAALRNKLRTGLEQTVPGFAVNGEPGHPGILSGYFPGIRAEALTAKLSARGICVSPGAACAARDPKPSHVLLAMGCSEERASHSVRFSLGRNTTEEEIDETLAAIGEVLSAGR